MSKKFGLIGYPLDHSFSQKYFTEKFEKEKLSDCSYHLFPIQNISELTDILALHPDLVGLNVTIPYKQQVLSSLHSVAGLPEGLNASNCIKIVEGRLFGYNTDTIGFEKSLVPLLKKQHTKALIFGDGGSTVAIKYVLNKLNVEVLVVSRSKTMFSYQDITQYYMETHTLLINATPVGMYPHIDQVLPIPFEYITPEHLCYDLIYNPSKTQFLKNAEEKGATIKNGLEMLVEQAEASWTIWNS